MKGAMYCIRTPSEFEEHIKKSRFIGVLVPCVSETEIHNQLVRLADLHPHASHIVFAYRLLTSEGLRSRFHDAGEPGGTAGKPIYQHLEGAQLINCLLAVIRYFGGIKLGKGGLTRAYASVAKQVIALNEPQPYIEMTTVSLIIDYKQLPSLEHHLKSLDGQIVEQDFSERIALRIRLPQHHAESLLALWQAS